MKFNITRDRLEVEISIEPGLLNYSFPFRFQAGNDWSAELLMKEIRRAHSEAVQEARREAYDRGWADAKAKRKKNEFFSGCLG